MIMKTSQTDEKTMLGVIIGLLAGLWGIVVALLFAVSQIQMISPDTPLNLVVQSNGLGFLYLTVQLVAFALLSVVVYAAIVRSPYSSMWPNFFILVSILFIALSLIPGSTVGIPILPAAVGMLASGLLLKSRYTNQV
jgi:hypothetical protein